MLYITFTVIIILLYIAKYYIMLYYLRFYSKKADRCILELKKIVKRSAFIKSSFELDQRAFTTTSVLNLRVHGFGGINESPEIV